MGTARSLDAAWKVNTGPKQDRNRTHAPSWWRERASRFNWTARAAAYDAHLALLQQEQRERAIAQEEARWVARRVEQREREWQMSQDMLGLCEKMLDTVLEHFDANMKRWAVRDIALLAETASRVARLSTEMETDRELLEVDVRKLSDTELETFIERVRRQIERSRKRVGDTTALRLVK